MTPKDMPRLLPLLAVVPVLAVIARAQSTGFNQTAAGTYDYNSAANWVDADINGIWDADLTLAGTQTVQFGADTTLTGGLQIAYGGSFNLTLAASGGPRTLTLGGDIDVSTATSRTITVGSTSSTSSLNVDLGGAVRTFSVRGAGYGAGFARSLVFHNTLSNGGLVVTGGYSGGGLVSLNALSTSLDSLTIREAELSFNGSSNSSANTTHTIAGAVTADGGAATLTLRANASRNTTVQADSFARGAGSIILFRGDGLGTQTVASATAATANLAFANAPTLTGGGGASGTTTIGIIAGAYGSTSGTGSGFGATGGLVTYDADKGVRLLDTATEYTAGITDGQTQLDNVRIVNSSGTVSTTTLTSSLTTINSLSLDVTGATGNQGITIDGDPGATLRINSGVIYAYQNVTTGTNPAASDAITFNVPVIDLNGQEGIILVNTRLNTGGTVTSNAGLFINSAITNGTGLTIGDSYDNTSPRGYVVLGGTVANTYTGPTTINGAVVRLSKTGAAANTFGDVVLNLGSVYNSGNQIADTSDLTINAGTFYLNGSNNSGSATSETLRNVTIRGGSISSGSGTGNTLNIDGDLAMSGGTISVPTSGKVNVAGDTTLSGGVINIGRASSASVYNGKVALAGDLNLTNLAVGYGPYTAVSITAGSTTLGGQLELSGNVNFTGTANTNTVTLTAAAGTFQGVIALNGERTFDIGDGAAGSDLTLDAPLIDGASAGGLIKTGAGTLALLGTAGYTGATTVNAGRLLLGAADRIADTGEIRLGGGTFDTGGFSETLGTLMLTAGSVIDLGDGESALVFADSHAVTWTASVTLSILNYTEGLDSVRFGLDSDGLTLAQLAQITINGQAAAIDSSGYLSVAAVPEPASLALLAGLGGLLFAATGRRRR